MASLIDQPSYIVASKLIDTKLFGRKRSLAIYFFIGGACTLISTGLAEFTRCDKNNFEDPLVILSFICFLIGKFGASGSFAITYTWLAYKHVLFSRNFKLRLFKSCITIRRSYFQLQYEPPP